MTVHALARIVNVGCDHAAGNYNISMEIAATNGAANFLYSPFFQIPLVATALIFNAQLALLTANYVSAQLGVIVLPGSVIFPLHS